MWQGMVTTFDQRDHYNRILLVLDVHKSNIAISTVPRAKRPDGTLDITPKILTVGSLSVASGRASLAVLY